MDGWMMVLMDECWCGWMDDEVDGRMMRWMDG